MPWDRIEYRDLTAKQKEAFNFAKLSAVLADYGFSCTRVVDDDKGPDFVAYHAPSGKLLRVQQKSALSVHQAYEGKGLWIAFHVDQIWYLLKHDRLRDIVACTTNMLNTATARRERRAFSHHPSKRLLAKLEPYRMSRRMEDEITRET